jgi:hypothetical protein
MILSDDRPGADDEIDRVPSTNTSIRRAVPLGVVDSTGDGHVDVYLGNTKLADD